MGSVAVETAAADELVALAEPTAAVHNADEMDTDAVVQVGLNVGGQGHAAGGGRSGLLQFVPTANVIRALLDDQQCVDNPAVLHRCAFMYYGLFLTQSFSQSFSLIVYGRRHTPSLSYLK